MRVGMVRTAAGEPSVAVSREGGWVPLLAVRDADRLGPAATDLLTFLGGGEQVRSLAEELVTEVTGVIGLLGFQGLLGASSCWGRRCARWPFATARCGKST